MATLTKLFTVEDKRIIKGRVTIEECVENKTVTHSATHDEVNVVQKKYTVKTWIDNKEVSTTGDVYESELLDKLGNSEQYLTTEMTLRSRYIPQTMSDKLKEKGYM